MKHVRLMSVAAIAVALIASPSIANATTPPPSPTGDPNSLSAIASKAAPISEKRIALTAGASAFTGKSSKAAVSIPNTVSDNVVLRSFESSPSAWPLTVGLPTIVGASKAAVADDGTITYDGGSATTAIAVQALDNGVRIETILKSAQSASEFSYPVAVPAGGHLKLDDGGRVLIIAGDGSLVGGFGAPWAKDSNGVAVATRYEVRGNAVVQIVDHTLASHAYPIVADPYLGIGLIDHATWVYNSGYGYTLQVYPTGWARGQAGSYLVGTFDWDELYTKYRYRGLNTNLNGMRDQLICHQVVVAVVQPLKASWNIDEWRPDVGYLQTVNARCNPGGTKIFD